VHGTLGVSNREENWAKFFHKNSYNVLIVDLKTGRFTGPQDRHRVNYEALVTWTHQWLKDHPDVDPNNITYMGLSLGGFLGFYLDDTAAFKNYILFYPGCWHLLNRRESLVVKERINPTILVWGTDDSYEEGTFCPQVVKKMSGNFEWLAIQGAGHGFDGDRVVVSFEDIASPSGRASLSPNTSATNIARSKVLQFIKPVK
jgi:dienelactone hydrolase